VILTAGPDIKLAEEPPMIVLVYDDDTKESLRGRDTPSSILGASFRHSCFAVRLADSSSSSGSGYGIYAQEVRHSIGELRRITNLDHDMRGVVSVVGRVKVARQACRLAIRAYVDRSAYSTVKAGADNSLQTAGGNISLYAYMAGAEHSLKTLYSRMGHS
jgi:hypothetical protein